MTGNDPSSSDPHNAPRCSIVIRAFNEEGPIRRLLDGISQQTIRDVEVILVDSGSTDRTTAVAAGFGDRVPLQILSIHPDEFTFGRSLNYGIAQARAPLVVIASAHVYPIYPDWLEGLLAPFDDPAVALSYGRQRGAETSRFSEHQIFARWFPDHSQPRQATPFCNNANAAVRRSLWEQRPYDETLSGLEDLDWARWATGQGHAIAYVAEAEVVHVHHETPAAVYNRYRREAMAFKRIFPQEQFHLGDFVRLVSTNIASDLWHAARQGQLSRSFASIFWFRWMQFWGTYRGYRQSGPLTWQLRRTFYYPPGWRPPSAQSARSVAPIRYPEG